VNAVQLNCGAKTTPQNTKQKRKKRKDERIMAILRWVRGKTVRYDVSTIKSDCWSFAVLLWEIFSHGQRPYAALANYEITAHIEEGKRRLLAQMACVDFQSGGPRVSFFPVLTSHLTYAFNPSTACSNTPRPCSCSSSLSLLRALSLVSLGSARARMFGVSSRKNMAVPFFKYGSFRFAITQVCVSVHGPNPQNNHTQILLC
jgi:hypothetical protein